jgi:GDPmannose 4,6-dehydratase
MKKACITSCGQIATYLIEQLLQDDYQVMVMARYGSTNKLPKEITNHKRFTSMYGDIGYYQDIVDFVEAANQSDIFIHTAAQSNVKLSFEQPELTMKLTGSSVEYCLDIIRRLSPKTHFVQLSSCEQFGGYPAPQNEETPFSPQSPYARAKCHGFNKVQQYRDYGLFASNAILFNTESPRRPENYVSRKIVKGACRIKLGLQEKLLLGNIEGKRDFSHAYDAANAIIKIAQAEKADDFIVSSNQSHSIRKFVELAFSKLELNWQDYVVIDPDLYRENAGPEYCGDNSKIKKKLNWEPKYTFDSLIGEMIEVEMKGLNE